MQLAIQIPDDLARQLESLAASEDKSVEQLALERLQSSVETATPPRKGSAEAVLRAIRRAPHLSVDDVEELDRAIASGRLPVQDKELFPE